MLAPTPQPGHWRTSLTDVKAIKAEIDDWLYTQLEGIVQDGPFAGMRILHEVAWKETRLAPLLLGCYEEELHGELERQINRLKKIEQPKIVVIGAAEGYYAVGLKCRLPNADVFVVEPDEKSLGICRRTAVANGVELRQGDLDFVIPWADLLVMDCEGNEIHYLDVDRWPQLRQANVIVELHNFPATTTQAELKCDDIVLERFRGSHRITMLVEGPRNPNRYKWLCTMTSDYRWLALSENRPCLMGWFVMEPKGLYCP